jgi:pimeloyl-ACP methyl ester carboxylesterase
MAIPGRHSLIAPVSLLLMLAAGADGAQKAQPRPTRPTTGTPRAEVDRPPMAATTSCGDRLPGNVTAQLVAYVDSAPAGKDDSMCDADRCRLYGWLYLPKGSDRLPVLVYNHGHEQERGEPCGLARYFTDAGFALFAPLRRGHIDRGSGRRNTGIHVDEWATKVTGITAEQADANPVSGGLYEIARVDYLRDQHVRDVRRALAFVGGEGPVKMPRLDPGRVALLGHSYGGAVVLFSGAAFGEAVRAVIDVSGAELSWSNDERSGNPWRERMADAVDKRKAPLFLLQPANGKSVEPTLVLARQAARSGDSPFMAGLYPAILPDKDECGDAWNKDDDCAAKGKLTAKAIHSRFIGDSDQITIWGPAALGFLRRNGVK